MLTKRIIPCLDVKGGRVVKGVQFLELRDAGDPVEIAEAYDQQGADELTFLDITASHEERDTIIDVVRRTAEQVFMPLTVGGGIRTVEDIRRMLNAGADKISINTAAVHRPEFVKEAAERFGSQCTVVAIDARRVPGEDRWEVYTHGGRKPTGIDAVEWAVRMEAVRCGRDPADQHGLRRHQGRLRHRPDPRRGRRGLHPGHRLGRRRQPGASLRRFHQGRGQCLPGGIHLPLPGIHHR